MKTSASICLLKADDQYLLLKRNKDPFAGHYVPVGGKIELHESPIEAAVRETHEETGIRISTPRYCGTLVETSPVKYNWILFVYCAEIAWQEPGFCNEGVLEWIHRDGLLDVPTPKTDLHIYDYILRRQAFMFNAHYDEDINLVSMTEEIENIKLIG
ncbi:MAG: NUDIX hydrolase [Calditrichia bacterium]